MTDLEYEIHNAWDDIKLELKLIELEVLPAQIDTVKDSILWS